MQAEVINPNHAREQLNGARMIPQGYRLGVCIPNYTDACLAAKAMERTDIEGNTYNVTGVAGSYYILKYAPKLVIDQSYTNPNVKSSVKY